MATDFETLARVALPCPTETWVTDGARLAVIEGIDAHGRYLLLDAHTTLDRDAKGRLLVKELRFAVLADVLLRRWRVVPPPDPTNPRHEEIARA